MDLLKLISSKLKENPGAIFGMLYPYILTLVVIVGLYYVSKLDFITKQKIPAVVPDTTIISDLPMVRARTVPAIDIKKLAEPTTDLLAAGKNIFVTMCASCHGEDGKGNGPGAAALNPPPRNFENEEGWKNGITLSGIYTTLQEGIPGTGMISYEILTPKDKFSLIHYMRSEFISNPPKVSTDELAALDQLYNLSAGTDIPAQIPVADAIQIVVEENLSKIEKVNAALTNIQNSSSEGANLFCKVTDDEFIALSGLVVDNEWNDENSFKKLLTGNLNNNGFNGNIFSINDNEWSILFSFLKNNI
jgi:mono/diheme cytochrome c family protein